MLVETASDYLYLREDAKLEPLVDRWYAWPHLMSPVQQAMNLAFRYLPIARSFVANPEAHVSASRDPEMFGGPFMELPASAAAAVKAYVAETERNRSRAIAFAGALRSADGQLVAKAAGYSLDGFKQALPPALRGLVGAVYDLNHHPKVQVHEEMFEKDDLGLTAAQSVFIHDERDDERPFFLSTPRLGTGGGVLADVSFAGPAFETLVRARREAVDLQVLAAALGAPAERLRPYFSAERPRAVAPEYAGAGVRIRYFGHASLLLQTSGFSILFDPTLSWGREPKGATLCFSDLPERIDVLALSHGHLDHMSPEVLLQLRDRVGVVLVPRNNTGDLADPSMKRMLKRLGYQNVIALDSLDEFPLPEGLVRALPFSGEHCDLDVHSKQCFLLELKGRRICIFVDSDAIDLDVYRRITPTLAQADLVFIGMECFGAPLSWLYGPLMTRPASNRDDGSRRLSGANCHRAWNLMQEIRPKRAYVYAMGQEPWMRHQMGLNYKEESIQLKESSAFVDRCRGAGITSERLYGCFELEI